MEGVPNMTYRQEMNVLYWVEDLLSDKYKFGRGKLYDPVTNCFCALGVAAMSQNVPRNLDGTFMSVKEFGFQSDAQWFRACFGLPHTATLYSSLNDHSKDYLAVAALLLHTVPDTNRSKARVHKQFMEKVDATVKARQEPYPVD